MEMTGPYVIELFKLVQNSEFRRTAWGYVGLNPRSFSNLGNLGAGNEPLGLYESPPSI